MTAWLMMTLQTISLRQWYFYGIMMITLVFALVRIGGNLSQILTISRQRHRRTRYYTIRVWGTSPGRLRVFLVVDCIVVTSLCALTLIAFNDLALS